MSCARGFAELAAAVIRSGVDPEFLVQLEEDQGDLKGALGAALPDQQAAALSRLRDDVWARSNVASGEARWRTCARLGQLNPCL